MSGKWIVDEVARLGDMSPRRSLRIEAHRDGDVRLFIEEDGVPIGGYCKEGASIEFCSPSGGGGRSKNVCKAIYQLIKAIKKDNAERPDGIPKFPQHLRKQ